MILSVLLAATLLHNHNPFPDKIEPPLGLREIEWPQDNLYSKEKANLGRILYFDKRLSSDGTVSCASCHTPPCGYSDCRVLPIGIGGKQGTRNSPSVINSVYAPFYFWDGRAATLEEQCKGPLANPAEMTHAQDPHEAHMECADRVSNIEGYKPFFEEVFGTNEITIDQIAQAIATFERTILSGNSPYDCYIRKDKEAMSKEQIRGLQVFRESKCSACHAGFNFDDFEFRNIGIGMDRENPDLGRYLITGEDKDWGSFKVPTLRDVSNNSPYMHDGSLATLEEVVEYYNKGGIPNKNLHFLITPLNLSEADKKALVSFMKALDGEGWHHHHEPKEFP